MPSVSNSDNLLMHVSISQIDKVQRDIWNIHKKLTAWTVSINFLFIRAHYLHQLLGPICITEKQGQDRICKHILSNFSNAMH